MVRQFHGEKVFIRGDGRNGTDGWRSNRRIHGNGAHLIHFFKHLIGWSHELHDNLSLLDGRKPPFLIMDGHQHGAQGHLNAHSYPQSNQYCRFGGGTRLEPHNPGLFIHKQWAKGKCLFNITDTPPLTSSSPAIRRTLLFCYLHEK